MELLLDSQTFLREAAHRLQIRNVAETIARAEVALEQAKRVLPNHLSDRNDVPTESVDDETDGVIDVSQAIERAERILPGQVCSRGGKRP